tara:strand:- start:1181 stop:1540 length:360 start_codon:yes stop_codon:yes gene_type:complete
MSITTNNNNTGEEDMDNRQHKFDEIKSYIEDDMENFGGLENEDLHHEMLNMDYYIIGTYKAEQWLGSQVFECIRTVHEYEDFHFGERYTDTSDPEKLVNMYAYIIGEQIINTMREEQDD